MIISIPDPWGEVRGPHTAYVNALLEKFIDPARKLRKGEKASLAITKKFVAEVKDLVISENIDDILESIAIYNKYKVNARRSSGRFVAELSKLFSYGNFKTKKKSWDAYKFCSGLKVKVCPYCHQVELPTLLLEKVGRGFRPALDHFFHKDQYPHLALSISNFIPSCTTCNTSLKGEIDFFDHRHLHPYFDEENVSFSFAKVAGDLFVWENVHSSEDFELIIGSTIHCEKTRRSIRTFMIEPRYALDFVKGTALDYAHAKLDWESTKNNDQIAIVRGFRHKESILTQFDRANYKNLRLGKLRASIHDGLSQ